LTFAQPTAGNECQVHPKTTLAANVPKTKFGSNEAAAEPGKPQSPHAKRRGAMLTGCAALA
jgi:hypothetical protein